MAALRACRGEPEQTLRWAQAAIDAGRERGYAYRVAMGRLLRGWALAAGGRADGAEEIAAGLEAARATGARLEDPFFLGLLADAHLRGGNAEAGLAAVEEALAIAERERAHFFDAELRRLRGELLLAAGRSPEAAASSLREALAVARSQGARSLELRAALALARLAEGGPDAADARAGLLAALEALAGDDSADARAASALLAGDRGSHPGDGVSRRRITVLAWEVDGLGELAESAEPERLLEVVGACHAAARDAAAGAGGHVATEDESGGLIYFGFPQALENAPQRAVRSGLALAEALATDVDGVALRVCAGVHIGAAVIGQVGDAELAMGRAPRTAWHLAAAAPPGELLVSDTTRDVCAREFEFAAHGAGHRVTGELRAGRPAGPRPVAAGRARARACAVARTLGAGGRGARSGGARERRGRDRQVPAGARARGEPRPRPAGDPRAALPRRARRQRAAPGRRALPVADRRARRGRRGAVRPRRRAGRRGGAGRLGAARRDRPRRALRARRARAPSRRRRGRLRARAGRARAGARGDRGPALGRSLDARAHRRARRRGRRRPRPARGHVPAEPSGAVGAAWPPDPDPARTPARRPRPRRSPDTRSPPRSHRRRCARSSSARAPSRCSSRSSPARPSAAIPPASQSRCRTR